MEAKELERLWSEHLDGEFGTKDAEATLATMVDDASVNHIPVNSGGRGKEQLRAFYRDVFIPSWPDDLEIKPVNRVVGDDQLVDELHATFTHSRRMDWFLHQIRRVAARPGGAGRGPRRDTAGSGGGGRDGRRRAGRAVRDGQGHGPF